jgi:hypothetical protein
VDEKSTDISFLQSGIYETVMGLLEQQLKSTPATTTAASPITILSSLLLSWPNPDDANAMNRFCAPFTDGRSRLLGSFHTALLQRVFQEDFWGCAAHMLEYIAGSYDRTDALFFLREIIKQNSLDSQRSPSNGHPCPSSSYKTLEDALITVFEHRVNRLRLHTANEAKIYLFFTLLGYLPPDLVESVLKRMWEHMMDKRAVKKLGGRRMTSFLDELMKGEWEDSQTCLSKASIDLTDDFFSIQF